MRKIVTVRVHQIVDPLHSNGCTPLRLYGERRSIVNQRLSFAPRSCRAIAPYSGRGQTGRKNLLGKLLDRDLIIVNVRTCLVRDCPGQGHDRRNEHRRLVLGNAAWIQRSPSDPRDGFATNEQADATGCQGLEEVPSVTHPTGLDRHSLWMDLEILTARSAVQPGSTESDPYSNSPVVRAEP